MSMTVSLPNTLRNQLAGVARRVRLQHLLRGISLLVLILAVVAGLAFLTDYLLGHSLPPLVRGGLLALWAGLGLLLLTGLGRRVLQPLQDADLASLIESRYPELGERLTSSVELCDNPGVGSGSPALIALLVQETEARTSRLDLGRVISDRSTSFLMGLAALALLITLAPAAVAPAEYSYLAQRFFQPWVTPAPLADFTFEVSPGEGHAARGRPFAVNATLSPRRGVELPRKALLVVTATDGNQTRVDMTPDNETGRYAASFRVSGDCTYHVESGNASSDSFTLGAVTPVDLASDSPTIEIQPPAYAASALETETLTGMIDLACLQHSGILLTARFNRPAVQAFLEWTPTGAKESVTTPLTLAEDRLSGTFRTVAREGGSYRLVLEAEHGVKTERDGGSLTVRPDQPPALLKFDGKEKARLARAYDRIPIEARLADDIAVAGAAIEFRINDEKEVRSEPIKLDGSREALARHLFLLAGKVKPGDTLAYRLRYQDNLPTDLGGPHVRFHPAEGWFELKIVAEGGSLKEQEIQARKDAINNKLEEIRADLKQEQRKAMNVRAESRTEDDLSPRNAENLGDLRKQAQKTEKDLEDIAREASEETAGEKLAELARDVADKQMREVDSNLARAQKTREAADRQKNLQKTEDDLSRALARLEKLKEANEQMARDQQDQARLEALADRQQQLAEKAAEMASKHPVLDPNAKKQAEQVRREQEEVAQELRKLTDQSPALRKALEQARAEQARQAADKASELAQAQRELARASEQTERKRDAERLGALAQKQQELARQASDLSKETEKPARANFAKPLETNDAEKAAESLKQGESQKAVQEQDRAAREMERLARDLDRAAEVARDPKAAARQLARLEEDLMKKATSEKGAATPEKAQQMKREQQAIREATEKLSVPPRSDLQAEKKKATEALRQAEKSLEQQKPTQAQAAMEQARQALRELSNRMPSLEERKAQSQRELSKLMQDQAEASRKAEAAAREKPAAAERQMAEAASKQAEIAKALEKLDTPNAENRRERAAQAAKQAQADLQARKKEEAASSQAATKREMERLAQAMAGQKTPDQKAADLAERQRELARQAAEGDASKTPSEQMKQAQRQIAEEARTLESGEAPKEKQAAAESTARAAEEAARNPMGEAAKKAMADAAQKLDALAKQMGAQEAPKGESGKALPSKAQADAARKLAQAQRDLRDAVQKAAGQAQAERRADNTGAKENPAGQMAREQAEIAKQANQLAQAVNKEQGKQSSPSSKAEAANQAAQQASRSMQSGALPQAQKAGQQAGEQLRQLASELAKTPRRSDAPAGNDTLEQARQLAQRQEALTKQMAGQAENTAAQRAQQQARQQELARETAELMRQLEEVGRESQAPAAQSSARQAAQSARQAENSMQAARNQAQQGNQQATQAQRDMAAQNLDQVANQAAQAARSASQAAQNGSQQQQPGQAQGQPSSSQQQAGQSVQQARGQIGQAQQAMQQNQPGQAGQAMQQAAQQLAQAAQQLAQAQKPSQANTPSNPSEQGAAGGGAVDARTLPKELAAHAGKRWGELPGEVRTRIVQQMKARYGDDYARMIKLYFEQIADTRGRR
ncbi:MAG: hypothetical protein U0840_13900 [Gemmataceae bacterium]